MLNTSARLLQYLPRLATGPDPALEMFLVMALTDRAASARAENVLRRVRRAAADGDDADDADDANWGGWCGWTRSPKADGNGKRSGKGKRNADGNGKRKAHGNGKRKAHGHGERKAHGFRKSYSSTSPLRLLYSQSVSPGTRAPC